MSSALDILVLIDGFDDLVHEAKPVPLTFQVRLDSKAAHGRIEEMRAALARAVPPDSSDHATILGLIDELEEVVRQAKPVPLTDQIRFDREHVYDVLDRMRVELPEAIGRARRAAEEAATVGVELDEAARTLTELVERVKFKGERFRIESRGIAMAELRPPAD